jgi:HPt (histidine-containing phosphotransfer) domain-containing protein
MNAMNDSQAQLVADRLRALSEDTGVAPADLERMWLLETEERLSAATEALAAGDLPGVARIVHSAAGTSGICGAVGLCASLTSVERLAEEGRNSEVREGLACVQAQFSGLVNALKAGLVR